jgi:hypothetical protein
MMRAVEASVSLPNCTARGEGLNADRWMLERRTR